ncbi:CLUMA_CG001052, isoform A [Clunio marinus]|uniref:CLUMA_CG001052, isoform A n=1 Tax=Clunio marinus TaxID=568069 RepID=A0A1J1HI80_9DIPT|nr:CLUMA_CG001052, isoform A [Clunio marinus]
MSFANLIYRKYEKKHPRKNYVQIVEIFGTRQRPPHYLESEKDLNDFLARDAYKTDMNCTKISEDKSERVTEAPTTRPPSTTFPTIPTTAYWLAVKPTLPVTSPRTTYRTIRPNLNNMFTIRTTKPTIRPNPRENSNPDYTDLGHEMEPNVQMTKHRYSTVPPTIVIVETDDIPLTERTSLFDIDKERTTTRKSYSGEFSDDEIIYPDVEEIEENDAEYDENNYPEVIPSDQIEPLRDNYDDEVDEGYEDYDEQNVDLGRRRKRHKRKLVTSINKRKNTTKN